MTLSLLLLATLAAFPQTHPVVASASIGSPFEAVQDAPDPPPCTADIRWLNDTQQNLPRAVTRPLTLLTAVGRFCGGTTSLSAVFFDANDDVVCSGQVDLTIPRSGPYTHLEVRPGNVYEFLRWRNGPRTTNQQWARLACATPDGQTEAQPTDIDRARSLRLHATLVPVRGGVSVAELRILLLP
jgi:hypothetical protein